MWRNRSDWLLEEEEVGVSVPDHINEFWHGSKVKEYREFWDPRSTWKLPIICPNSSCKKAYRFWPTICEELEVAQNFNMETGDYNFPCVDCATEIKQQAIEVKGSPLNIALMGHWDGFQDATTVQKDCWTVEVVILNGGKRAMSNSKIAKPIPLLFIPLSSLLLHKKPEYHSLPAFLKPMWDYFQECFVHGFPVEIDYPLPDLVMPCPKHEPVIIRVIPMSWTGDGPAQSKIGGTFLMGYNGCRHDFLHAKSVISTTGKKKTKVVYNHNRFQARVPPMMRDVEGMNYYGKCLRDAATQEERDEYKRQSGLSYYSDMWSLYDLHGFNISLDLVHDPMHCLALGVFKTFNDRLLGSCDANQVKRLMKVLRHVTNNRPVGLGARWPHPPLYVKNPSDTGSKWKFSNYKAEEHLLFIQYCAAPILEELEYTLKTPIGAEGALLIHLSRVFFSVSRKHGWTNELLQNAKLHFSAWRVLTEEEYGPNGKIVEHVVGNGEILDDIRRHGHHDIFWCYFFERMVSSYNNITTNGKCSELSYASYFCRQLFLESFSQLQRDKDGLKQEERILSMLQCSLYPRIIGLSSRSLCASFYSQKVSMVTSIEKASELWSCLQFMSKADLPSMYAVAKGIAIGPNQGSESIIPVNGDISFFLQAYWLGENLLNHSNANQFRNKIEMVRGVIVDGVHYRKNDLVIVENDGKDMPSLKCKIKSFFLHAFNSHYAIFFEAFYYTPVLVEGTEERDTFRTESTDMSLLFDEPANQLGKSVWSVSKLLHRFMSHPSNGHRTIDKKAFVAFEFQDVIPRTHLLVPGKPGCCPPWLMPSDIVLIRLFMADNSLLHLAYIVTAENDKSNVEVGNSERKVEVILLECDHSDTYRDGDHEIFKALHDHPKVTLLWRSVLMVMDPHLFERIALRMSTIQVWKAPRSWTKGLLLKRHQISPPARQEASFSLTLHSPCE